MKACVVLLLGVIVTIGAPCLAQTPAQRLAEQARVHIDGLTFDSARVLLDATLRLATTPSERLRGYTLLAFTQLGLRNQTAARQAFEQALRLDPAMRIDSLADLDADAALVFAQARTVVGTPAIAPEAARVALQLSITVPADTLVSVDDARLPIIIQPNASSRVVSTIAAADLPGQPVWTDTQSTAGRQTLAWPLRGADGALLADGRYVLRSQATDSSGQATRFEERILRVARARVDTQSHPAALAASAFAPETLSVGGRTARVLLAGGSIAAAIAATPLLLGNPTLNKGLAGDPTAYAAAGGVAFASAFGFLRGRARNQVLSENVQRNRQLRDGDQRQRDAIVRANAEARSKAAIRVTVERSP